MADPKKMYYDKRGENMVKNLTSHGFEAYYCENKEEALKKALYSSEYLNDDVYKVLEDYLQKLKDNGELGLGMMQWEPRKGWENIINNYVI